MGGEMIFLHNDKPVEDLEAYKKILKEIENDCASATSSQTDTAATSVVENLDIRRLSNPISNWKNGHITKYGVAGIGQDDDYELSVDLAVGSNKENHYYVLFPKDPNTLKIYSRTHARGMNHYNKKWIHHYFLKFVTTFPGVFRLYYGDGYCGYSAIGEMDYRDGSDVPVVYYPRAYKDLVCDFYPFPCCKPCYHILNLMRKQKIQFLKEPL